MKFSTSRAKEQRCRSCKCHEKAAGENYWVLRAASLLPGRVPRQCRLDPPTRRVRGKIQRGHRCPRDCTAARLLLPGAGGEHLPPGVMGADGWRARMWPRSWAAPTPGKTYGRRGEARRQGACPQPSPPRRASRSNCLRPGWPLRSPALPSSAPGRPPHLLGSARSRGRDSQERGAASGTHHGYRGETAAVIRTPLPRSSAPSREPHLLPASPALRHRRAGSAHATGRGLRPGAGPAPG